MNQFMEENIKSPNKSIDEFSGEKDRMNIALYYTHHDSEKAGKMISGIYKDIYAVKAKFNASSTYGAFLLFFNIPYCSLVHSFAVMSPLYEVDEIKTKNGWRIFEDEIDKINKNRGQNSEMTLKLKDGLSNAFTLKPSKNQRANELKRYLEAKDEISANRLINKSINDQFGFRNITLSVDYEQISSLDMELFSISSKKVDKEILVKEEEKKEELGNAEEEEEDEDIDKKDIQLILTGTLVLSPVKGKPVSSVELGDRLKINLDNKNPKSITVAKAFKVYEDGKIFPITGRVVAIRHLLDGGYKIYCLIAKGIYVKIIEEEENVKVAAEMPDETGREDVSRTPVIIALGFVFFILLFVVLVLVLL